MTTLTKLIFPILTDVKIPGQNSKRKCGTQWEEWSTTWSAHGTYYRYFPRQARMQTGVPQTQEWGQVVRIKVWVSLSVRHLPSAAATSLPHYLLMPTDRSSSPAHQHRTYCLFPPSFIGFAKTTSVFHYDLIYFINLSHGLCFSVALTKTYLCQLSISLKSPPQQEEGRRRPNSGGPGQP